MSKSIQNNRESESELMGTQFDTPTFARYGVKFQEILVQTIIDDRAFSDQIGEVLEANYLESKHLQAMVKLIHEYREKFKVHPTRDILASLVKSNGLSLAKEAEVTQKQVADYFARVSATFDKPEGTEYVISTSLDFCRKQKIRGAMLQSVKLLKDASFDEISKILNDAMRLGTSNDAGTEYIVDFEKRYTLTSRSPISTGWEEIDKITQNGLGSGELGVFIAAPGRGKSHMLVHVGMEAIKAGKNVFHYTLELSEDIIGKRYDACSTGFSINELPSVKSEVFDLIKTLPGRLLIKQYPTKMAGTNTIRNHIDKQIAKGIYPNMVIVDYGDLLKPPKSQYAEEKRHGLEAVYEDLRAIAIQYKLPVWTASQVGRSAANEECITMESIAEAYSKCYVADFIMSLSRTRKDVPVKGGRVFVAKNRNGDDNLLFPLFFDTSNTTIRVLPNDAGKTVDEINAAQEKNTSREQLKKLRELYKTVKKENE